MVSRPAAPRDEVRICCELLRSKLPSGLHCFALSIVVLLLLKCILTSHAPLWPSNVACSSALDLGRPRTKTDSNDAQAMSRGVIYFGYHMEPARAAEYVAVIAKSAAILKQHNPLMQVAVMTNAILTDEQKQEALFDVVQIPPSDIFPGRQWWTRILHLNSSPFDYTLVLDSDRVVCGDISSVFTTLAEYDMLEVSAGILPAFDNGVMAFKKGKKFDQLIANWKHYQMRRGQFGNDQPALGDAIDKTVAFSSGILPPIWQVKYIPAQGEKWGNDTRRTRTLVLHGEVKIYAGSACPAIVLVGKDRSRVIAWNRDKHPSYRTVFSQAECDEFLENTCMHEEIDWDANYTVMPRSSYLLAYGH